MTIRDTAPYEPDGKFPPFKVLDVKAQTHIFGPTKDRKEAETIAEYLRMRHGESFFLDI